MKNWFYIILLLIILIGLCYYGKTHKPWLSLAMCLKNSELYDGQQVTYISEPQIGKISSDGFILHYAGGTIPVISDTAGLREKEYIGMIATFHKEGYLQAEQVIISKNRRFKILFSILPVLLIIVLFFFYFRINLKPLQIEMKHA